MIRSPCEVTFHRTCGDQIYTPTWNKWGTRENLWNHDSPDIGHQVTKASGPWERRGKASPAVQGERIPAELRGGAGCLGHPDSWRLQNRMLEYRELHGKKARDLERVPSCRQLRTAVSLRHRGYISKPSVDIWNRGQYRTLYVLCFRRHVHIYGKV